MVPSFLFFFSPCKFAKLRMITFFPCIIRSETSPKNACNTMHVVVRFTSSIKLTFLHKIEPSSSGLASIMAVHVVVRLSSNPRFVSTVFDGAASLMMMRLFLTSTSIAAFVKPGESVRVLQNSNGIVMSPSIHPSAAPSKHP